MKKLFFLTISLGLCSACSDYQVDFDQRRQAFNDAFQQTFGQIDPQQDFSMAQRYTLRVTPGLSHTISIYSDVQGCWQLVGRYSHIATVTELGFDAARSATQFLVSDGLRTFVVPVGGSVDFSGATRADGNLDSSTEQLNQSDAYSSVRTVRNWLNEGVDIDNTIGGYPYFYYNASTLTGEGSVLAKMPAINEPATNQKRGNLEQTDVLYDFCYVSTGTFIVYPVYWCTTRINTVGVCYQDPSNTGNVIRIPLFGNAAYNESVQWTTAEDNPFWSTCRKTSASGLIEDYSTAANIADNQYLRSKGIIVDIPAGTQFGFYMITDEGYVQYTEASRNNDVKWTESDSEKACYFANFTTRGLQWLCMEDNHDLSTNGGSHSDFDFDDFICLFGGNNPTPIDNEAPSWLLAFEDLGDTFDWDYNDVVLKFSYVSGTGQARIIPLAAGGTLPSVIHFNDGNGDQTVGEIHQLLGASPQSLYEPIHADQRGQQGATQIVSITNSDFSITTANDGMSSNDHTAAQSATGITIAVNGGDETNYIAYQGAGHAPEVLILPNRYNHQEGSHTYAYTWAWPQEMKRIYMCYAEPGHTFNDWIADHTQAQDWYKYPTKDVVEEQKVLVADGEGSAATPSGTAVHTREYNWAETIYGTPLAIPEPDPSHNYLYRFDVSDRLIAGQSATLTLVATGGLKVSNGRMQDICSYGSWASLKWQGNIKYNNNPQFDWFSETMMTRLNTYDPDMEVMCKISLTAEEVTNLLAKESNGDAYSEDTHGNGQLMIWAGKQLVALSIKR